jgi:hypothetical protein
MKTLIAGAALAVALGLCHAARAQHSHALDYVVQPHPHGQHLYAADGSVLPSPDAGYDAGGVAGGAVLPSAPPEQVPPPLDYNYYYPVPGGYVTPARLYLAPRPVPLHVGYTYITYQAFAPHEYLYAHRAAYQRPYCGGVTVTRVRWGTGFCNHLHHALHSHH